MGVVGVAVRHLRRNLPIGEVSKQVAVELMSTKARRTTKTTTIKTTTRKMTTVLGHLSLKLGCQWAPWAPVIQ